jgi:hypothetical protein
MFGYLHINGHMHISGKYSLKHIEHKHFSTVFTIKERSHVKLYLKHSKITHAVNLFLLNNKKEVIHAGNVTAGPSGLGSASFIDIYLDPIYENGEYKNYEIRYFIKDINIEDSLTYSYSDMVSTELTDECFNTFIELQINNNVNDIVTTCGPDRFPQLLPSGFALFDFHTFNSASIDEKISRYSYTRKGASTEAKYFYHEYFYVPDHLDQEVILDIEIYSNFMNSQVGVLLEVINTRDHRGLTAQDLKNMYPDVVMPECKLHCFTGIKKFNLVVLERI